MSACGLENCLEIGREIRRGGLTRVLGHGQKDVFGDRLRDGWIVDGVGWMVYWWNRLRPALSSHCGKSFPLILPVGIWDPRRHLWCVATTLSPLSPSRWIIWPAWAPLRPTSYSQHRTDSPMTLPLSATVYNLKKPSAVIAHEVAAASSLHLTFHATCEWMKTHPHIKFCLCFLSV
jgi:hypothetical protein